MLKQYSRRILIILAAMLASSAWSIDFDEGIEYKLVKPPVPSSVGKEKVEVVEMFWYGCPHCFTLEPKINKWKQSLAKNVEFVRVPAVFPGRPTWELHARAYYTAELLGILDKIHGPMFDRIHKEKQHMHSVTDLAAFFAGFGVDKATVKDTMYSFGVEMKVNRAVELTRRYQIDGVPTMIVAGKYRTHASLTDGQNNMLKAVDFLINKEKSSKK